MALAILEYGVRPHFLRRKGVRRAALVFVVTIAVAVGAWTSRLVWTKHQERQAELQRLVEARIKQANEDIINGASKGDADRVRQCLAAGASPNARSRGSSPIS